MSRPSAGGLIGGCISLIGGCIVVTVMLVLFGAYLIPKVDDLDDGPSTEPASRPTATTKAATPPDSPEEADTDSTSGTGGGQNSNKLAGIQFGYACSPVGALGNAKDGRPAKCYMGKDGRARWGYDSNRG
ncbi:hypothetical protein ACFCWG_30570 [Streptomyces sp. NPDC056390]|uniref:hypothetical protein n=1 Tax=Streptomyces sp. NPDC056390 TaxID=3345806 RepID=UPI0035D545C1